MYTALSLWPRLRRLPTLARDGFAVLLILGLFAAGAGLPMVTIPGALLPLLPALLLVAVAFGRNSAVLAALLAALAVRQQWFGPSAGQEDSTAGLVLMAIVLAGAVAVSGLLDAWRRRRAEAVLAHEQVDATARLATERLAMAHRTLWEAQERLAQAEAEAQAQRPQRPPGPDAILDSAFRSEGGI